MKKVLLKMERNIIFNDDFSRKTKLEIKSCARFDL